MNIKYCNLLDLTVDVSELKFTIKNLAKQLESVLNNPDTLTTQTLSSDELFKFLLSTTDRSCYYKTFVDNGVTLIHVTVKEDESGIISKSLSMLRFNERKIKTKTRDYPVWFNYYGDIELFDYALEAFTTDRPIITCLSTNYIGNIEEKPNGWV